MARSERICAKCQESFFEEDLTVCPSDGGLLLYVGSASEPDRIGRTIDGKVTLLEEIGRGGMGTVYRALQHSMEREVAIKLLSPRHSESRQVVRRFLQEAKGASRLNHPHVITLFDFGQTEERELYLLMELLDGAPLADALAAEGPLEPARAVDIAIQVCDALHHAHENDVIHRDLKPDNVFLLRGQRRRDFVKVLDFGIAKVAAGGDVNITRAGTVCGTPAYMSPEQAAGDPVDRRSDVYAIGLLLYEMLTGARPFEEETPSKLLLAHIRDTPMPLSGVRPALRIPAALEQVVMCALAKRPEARPATAMDLADWLHATLEAAAGPELTAELVKPPPGRASSPSERREPVHIALADTATAMPTPAPFPARQATLSGELWTAPALVAGDSEAVDREGRRAHRNRRIGWWAAGLVLLTGGALGTWGVMAGWERGTESATPAAQATSGWLATPAGQARAVHSRIERVGDGRPARAGRRTPEARSPPNPRRLGAAWPSRRSAEQASRRGIHLRRGVASSDARATPLRPVEAPHGGLRTSKVRTRVRRKAVKRRDGFVE